GHLLAHPMPDTLTPSNVISDFLSVAEVAGADRFAYYGYSWLGMTGLQLALSTDRLAAVAVGGWPPIDAPYREMLLVTLAGYELATGARSSGGEDEWADAFLAPDQQRQFLTLYQGPRWLRRSSRAPATPHPAGLPGRLEGRDPVRPDMGRRLRQPGRP